MRPPCEAHRGLMARGDSARQANSERLLDGPNRDRGIEFALSPSSWIVIRAPGAAPVSGPNSEPSELKDKG